MTAVLYALGVILFVVGVTVSIALHEVGHLVPAKLFGVRVTQYMVGFGPTLWSRRKGETEYGIKAIPMGGFIRMVGMLPPPRLDAEGRPRGAFQRGFFGRLIADARDAEADEMAATPEHRQFYRKAGWQKIIVMASGPLVNVVLAIALLGGVWTGIGVPRPTLTVGAVSHCVLPGDTVRPCRPDDPVSPAARAHLRPDDVIVSYDGRRVTSWDDLTAHIRATRGPVDIVLLRDGRRMVVRATPVVTARPDPADPSTVARVGFLGITPTTRLVPQGPGYVASTMWGYTKHTATALVEMPARMWGVAKAAVFADERSQDSPMSVVGASRVAGEVASTHETPGLEKWAMLLTLLGVVNLFVAVFNFVPLLPLDGGHIAGAVYEGARRGWARLRGRPDPGYADVAQMLPVAYAVASVLVVMGALLIWTDIVNPIRLSQ